MKFFDYINKKVNEDIDDIPDNTIDAMDELPTGVHKDNHYFDVVDPDTGLKYDIPLLSTNDPAYFFKYIRYMKMREQSPDTFNKLLNWD